MTSPHASPHKALPWAGRLSLRAIARRYPGIMTVTWGLLLLEALIDLFFPLAIGLAVDGMLDQDMTALYGLALLCFLTLLFGSGRRFFDTRAYARIYRDLALGLARGRKSDNSQVSRQSAQLGMLEEVVRYFEEDLPGLLEGTIGLVGVIALLVFVDWRLALGCLVAAVIIMILYAVSGEKIYHLNERHNDVLEEQVDALQHPNHRALARHVGRLNRWRIRLSDLETWNFSAVWACLAILLVGAVWLSALNPALSHGQKITAIMYVFQFIELVMLFPLLYQQLVRLREITGRLSAAYDHNDSIMKSAFVAGRRLED